MGDAYWNLLQQQQQQLSLAPTTGMLKRPRTDYEVAPTGLPSGTDDDFGVQVVKDTKAIGSAYDRYLRSIQLSSQNSGEVSNFNSGGFGRTSTAAMPSFPVAEPPAVARSSGFASQLPADIMPMPGPEPVHLPPDASNTLFVEGLTRDTTKREVAHIFRPFVGYKEVRLVTKESKHRGGDPLVFCFVDFINPPCAATALSALQGYKMDEDDNDSTYLRLQFARNPNPGPRSRR